MTDPSNATGSHAANEPCPDCEKDVSDTCIRHDRPHVTPERAAMYEIAFRAFWGGKEQPPGTVWPSEVWLRAAVDAVLAEVGDRVKYLTTHDGMLYPSEVFAVLRDAEVGLPVRCKDGAS